MKIIYGQKGSGKTKQIIDAANAAVDSAKGYIIFVTDTKRYMYDLKREIRFIDVKDLGIENQNEFLGFVKGVVASNGDNEYVFIDGVTRITSDTAKELDGFFCKVKELEAQYNVKCVLTVSAAKEDLPDSIKE